MAKLRKLIRALEAEGWQMVEQRGDLLQYRHEALDRRLTLPAGRATLPAPVAASLALHAGLRWKGE